MKVQRRTPPPVIVLRVRGPVHDETPLNILRFLGHYVLKASTYTVYLNVTAHGTLSWCGFTKYDFFLHLANTPFAPAPTF